MQDRKNIFGISSVTLVIILGATAKFALHILTGAKYGFFADELYTIALSKIARGFESDLEDVLFMIQTGVIQYAELEEHFHEVLPRAAQFDIDPRDFRAYFAEIRRQMKG